MGICEFCGGNIKVSKDIAGAGTIQNRRNFKDLVNERLVQRGDSLIGDYYEQRTFYEYRVYMSLRTIDRVLNGAIRDNQRLTDGEFTRLVSLLDKVLPAQEPPAGETPNELFGIESGVQ